MQLTLATYNIHKGMSFFGQRFMLNDLKHALDGLRPDLIFLQEVQGEKEWQVEAQHEFLSTNLPHEIAYGKNAIYDGGHHGNAVMSVHPIVTWQNYDLSLNPFEQRGVLHCTIQLPLIGMPPLHALCVHLNLLGRDRNTQVHDLIDYIDKNIPPQAPMILAGDFNDWRGKLSNVLMQQTGLHEAFEMYQGSPAKSFPARLPLLSLDRVYIRGFTVQHAQVLTGAPWSTLSDHVPLAVTLNFNK